MQSDDMEFEFTPSVLNTPSLMTPTINMTVTASKANLNSLPSFIVANNNNNNNNISTSSTTTRTSSLSIVSSADVKLSKIEDDLKKSFSERRKPTESPFQ